MSSNISFNTFKQGNTTINGLSIKDGNNQLTILDITGGGNNNNANNDGNSLNDFLTNLFNSQTPQKGFEDALKKYADLIKPASTDSKKPDTTTASDKKTDSKTGDMAQKFKQMLGIALLATMLSELFKGGNEGNTPGANTLPGTSGSNTGSALA